MKQNKKDALKMLMETVVMENLKKIRLFTYTMCVYSTFLLIFLMKFYF